MLLIATIVILCALYREILFVFILLMTKGRETSPGLWDAEVRARIRSTPKIYLHKTDFSETIFLQTFWGPVTFIHQDLWNLWTDEEKSCYLTWVASASLRNSPIERIFFRSKVEILDRDVCLVGVHPLNLPTLLEKTIQFRDSHPASLFGGWLAGLSLLGPSFFGDWPTHEERLRVVASYLAELSKSK